MERFRISSSSSLTASVTESFEYMRQNVTKYSFMCTMDNFSCFQKGTSYIEHACVLYPEFSDDSNDNPKWYLRIFPKGQFEDIKEYVSLFLALQPSYHKKVRANFTFAILNASKKETNVSLCTDIRKFTNDIKEYWGYPKFIKRDVLFAKAGELLPDDKLTLCCHVSVFPDLDDISGQHRSIQIPGCNCFNEFGSLLQFHKLADVVLISADGRQLAAHKAILAARSPVFSSMFEHEMKERTSGRVEITDVDYEVLQQMLKYIYTGKVSNIEKPEDLLVAADKYDLDRLKMICEEFLCKNLSASNATDILIFADSHNANLLKAGAIDFIRLHASDMTDTAGWQEMFEDHPTLVDDVFRALAAIIDPSQ